MSSRSPIPLVGRCHWQERTKFARSMLEPARVTSSREYEDDSRKAREARKGRSRDQVFRLRDQDSLSDLSDLCVLCERLLIKRQEEGRRSAPSSTYRTSGALCVSLRKSVPITAVITATMIGYQRP